MSLKCKLHTHTHTHTHASMHAIICTLNWPKAACLISLHIHPTKLGTLLIYSASTASNYRNKRDAPKHRNYSYTHRKSFALTVILDHKRPPSCKSPHPNPPQFKKTTTTFSQ